MRCRSVGFGMASQTQSAVRFDYAKFRSRSYDAVIRVYDGAGNVIETHEHEGDFKVRSENGSEWRPGSLADELPLAFRTEQA